MSDSIPEFTSDGLLPPGDYTVTFDALKSSVLVDGPADKTNVPNWDAGWRLWLVDQLEVMAKQLWQVGVTNIFVDGSFVEDKEHPNDIDGYFECDQMRFVTGDLPSELNLIDPQKIWTWKHSLRRPYPGYPKKQLPMWHVYRVELYPHFAGLGSGIKDQHGSELEFPAAFRQSRRDSKPKGIIKLEKS